MISFLTVLFSFFLKTIIWQALRMKDEQLRILSDQNAQLLANLDKVEEDANNIQMEKLAVEEENRSLRDVNFELQVRIVCHKRCNIPPLLHFLFLRK
jgi:hypothetical protein